MVQALSTLPLPMITSSRPRGNAQDHWRSGAAAPYASLPVKPPVVTELKKKGEPRAIAPAYVEVVDPRSVVGDRKLAAVGVHSNAFKALGPRAGSMVYWLWSPAQGWGGLEPDVIGRRRSPQSVSRLVVSLKRGPLLARHKVNAADLAEDRCLDRVDPLLLPNE